MERLKAKMATMSAASIEDDIRTVGNVRVLAKKVAADTPAALRDAADKFRDKLKSGILVLGSGSDGRPCSSPSSPKISPANTTPATSSNRSPPSWAAAADGPIWPRPAVPSRRSWMRRWKRFTGLLRRADLRLKFAWDGQISFGGFGRHIFQYHMSSSGFL